MRDDGLCLVIPDVAVIVWGHRKPRSYETENLIDKCCVCFAPSLSLPSRLPAPGDATIVKIGQCIPVQVKERATRLSL